MYTLGNTEIETGMLGLGCWPIGGIFYIQDTPDGYGEIDEKEAVLSIELAVEEGIRLFDTADCYGAGHSEELLGMALKGKREKVVIATKFGFAFNESTKTIIRELYSPGYIERALDASLKRLGTDYIDLYQLHAGYVEQDKAEEVFHTLEKLRQRGKIRTYGWSTDNPEALSILKQFPNASAVQYECNVLKHSDEMITKSREMGLTGLNRSPLGMGLLSGKYRAGGKAALSSWDVRSQNYEWCPYFQGGEPSAEFLEKLDAIKEILQSEGRSLVQGALAWLWGVSSHHVPIPGFKNREQVRGLIGAVEKGPLTKEQIDEIGVLFRWSALGKGYSAEEN